MPTARFYIQTPSLTNFATAAYSNTAWPPNPAGTFTSNIVSSPGPRKNGPAATCSAAVACLRFDTSGLPNDAVITAARIGSQGGTTRTDGVDNFQVRGDYYDYGGGAAVTADFTLDIATSIFPQVDISSWIDGFSVDFTDLTGISKTGFTGVRIGLSSGTPTVTNNLTLGEIYLEVDYKAPHLDAVRLDTSTEATLSGAGQPYTFTHTPVGTPDAVLVAIVHGTQAAAVESGVTYGGVAMTLAASAQDTAGEPGYCAIYSLTANVPTGAQTVAVTRASTAISFSVHAVAATLLADGNVCSIIGASALGAGDTGTPNFTIGAGGKRAFGFSAHYDGVGNDPTVVPYWGSQKIQTLDFGNFGSTVMTSVVASTADWNTGMKHNSDDSALVGVLVAGAPANDNIANAITISGTSGTTAGNTIGATLEANEDTKLGYGGSYGATIWYKWTCPQTGTYTFRAEGKRGEVDVIISAGTGTGISDYVLVAQADQNQTDEIRFDAVASSSYYISIGGFSSATPNDQGPVRLLWRQDILNSTSLAFDAATESIRSTTADPHTFTHTPVGTPRAVVITIVQNGGTTNYVNAVTYGGVTIPMEGVSPVNNSVTEVGQVQTFMLGAGIPAGAQTVSVDMTTSTTAVQQIVCMTFTAADDVMAINGGGNSGGALTALTRSSSKNFNYGIPILVAFSGVDATSGVTDAASSTRVHDHDFGTATAYVWRGTTPSRTTHSIGGTQASSPGAYYGFSLVEKQAAASILLQAPYVWDNFAGSDLTGDWTRADTQGGTILLNNGRVEIDIYAGSNFGELERFYRYDFRGGEFALRPDVSQMVNFTDFTIALYHNGNGGNYFYFLIEKSGVNTDVYAGSFINDNRQLMSEAYTAANHKWLRLRESGGVIYHEKSADGVTWTTMASRTTPIRYDNCQVYMNVTPSSNATFVAFDDLNNTPVGASQLTILDNIVTAGRRSVFGVVQLTEAVGIQTIGKRTVLGSVTLPIVLNVATFVDTTVRGSVTMNNVLGISTQGVYTRRGVAQLTIAAGIATIGQLTRTGSVSMGETINIGTAGVATRRGSVTFPVALRLNAQVDPDYPILAAITEGVLELVVEPENHTLLMQALANNTLTLTVLPDQAP